MEFPKETTIKIEQRGDSHEITICGPSREDNHAIVREFLDMVLRGHQGVLFDVNLRLLASPTRLAKDSSTAL
jgi:hypothetical protein